MALGRNRLRFFETFVRGATMWRCFWGLDWRDTAQSKSRIYSRRLT
jgi:hypothetical protein